MYVWVFVCVCMCAWTTIYTWGQDVKWRHRFACDAYNILHYIAMAGQERWSHMNLKIWRRLSTREVRGRPTHEGLAFRKTATALTHAPPPRENCAKGPAWCCCRIFIFVSPILNSKMRLYLLIHLQVAWKADTFLPDTIHDMQFKWFVDCLIN